MTDKQQTTILRAFVFVALMVAALGATLIVDAFYSHLTEGTFLHGTRQLEVTAFCYVLVSKIGAWVCRRVWIGSVKSATQ